MGGGGLRGSFGQGKRERLVGEIRLRGILNVFIPWRERWLRDTQKVLQKAKICFTRDTYLTEITDK